MSLVWQTCFGDHSLSFFLLFSPHTILLGSQTPAFGIFHAEVPSCSGVAKLPSLRAYKPPHLDSSLPRAPHKTPPPNAGRETGEGAGGTLPQPLEGPENLGTIGTHMVHAPPGSSGEGPWGLPSFRVCWFSVCEFKWGLCSGSLGHSKLEGKLEKL